MVNVMQQVGGSLGLAFLVTAYSTAIRNAGHLATPHETVVHGMSTAFTLAAVLDVLAFAVIVVVMRGRSRVPAAEAELAPEPVRVPADS
jgi:hypothetical protein